MATIEQRLEALELALAAPLAVVPPMTIGSLGDVPVPGSAIAANWAQEVSTGIVHRFANKAAIAAWNAPVGARAVQVDTGTEWRRFAAGWSQVTPWTATAVGLAVSGVNPPGATVVNTLTIPADPGPRVAQISCFVRIQVYYDISVYLQMLVDGGIVAQAVTSRSQPVADLYPTWNLGLDALAPLSTGVAHQVKIEAYNTSPSSGSVFQTFANLAHNRLDATAVPG